MESKTTSPKVLQGLSPAQWIQLILTYLFIPAILFLCGGDLGWWQAWVFTALIFGASILGRIWAERRHPGLLAERAEAEKHADVKSWDKVLAPLMALSLSFPLVIVAGIDHRWGWSPDFPGWASILGCLLIGVGYGIGAWALVENRYFSGVVRIQTERGHQVCDGGPYRFVRHPGYAGNVLALPGIVLAFGSLWTLIPASALTLLIIIRTCFEDKTLHEELEGYRSYSEKVKCRLFPWIW